MKAIVCLGIVIVGLAVLVSLAPAEGSFAPEKLLLAWQNPVDPSLDSLTVNAALKLRSNLTIFVVIGGAAALGGLITFALSRP